MDALERVCSIGMEAIKDDEGIYVKDKLIKEAVHIIRDNMTEKEFISAIIQVSLELTTDVEPKWQYVAARLYMHDLYNDVKKNRNIKKHDDLYKGLYEFIHDLT